MAGHPAQHNGRSDVDWPSMKRVGYGALPCIEARLRADGTGITSHVPGSEISLCRERRIAAYMES